MKINLAYPSSWEDLDQKELRSLLGCIANVQGLAQASAFADADDYGVQTWAMIATRRIFAYNGIRVYSPYGDGYLIVYNKKEYHITAEQVAAAIYSAQWIREIPKSPVRLECVASSKGKFDAIDAELSGLPFGRWLEVENLWQGYNAVHDESLLRKIGEILYPGMASNDFSEAETLGIFYWIAAVKDLFARRFPHFFKSAGEGGTPDFDSLRRSADAQIRALTKGDVTKEDLIYDTDTARAITELDAQAAEYEELTKKYGKH